MKVRTNAGSREAGFTLMELIVSMAVMALLASAMVPLATASMKAEKIDEVKRELQALADAAEEFYFENAAFPTSLAQVGFYGKFFMPGVQDEAILDAWGGGVYRLSSSSNPDVLTIYSVGENGIDNGVAAEAFKTTVQGGDAGGEKTELRMRVIAVAVAKFVGGGGTLTGTWTTDHTAMGLAASYQKDGFGTDFRLDAISMELRSAGADRTFSNADDIVL